MGEECEEMADSGSRSVTMSGERTRGKSTTIDSMKSGPSVLAISSCQSANGSFPSSTSLASYLGMDPTLLKGKAEGWSTALAIAMLEARCAGQREEWELVVEKARRWLGARGELALVDMANMLLKGRVCDKGHKLQVR